MKPEGYGIRKTFSQDNMFRGCGCAEIKMKRSFGGWLADLPKQLILNRRKSFLEGEFRERVKTYFTSSWRLGIGLKIQ